MPKKLCGGGCLGTNGSGNSARDAELRKAALRQLLQNRRGQQRQGHDPKRNRKTYEDKIIAHVADLSQSKAAPQRARGRR
jgi:iron only hydrogenase large subunit-like protein